MNSPYRLAMRREGEWLNAYWARTETMEGAELVATIKVEIMEADPALHHLYQDLMAIVSTVLVKKRLGANASRVEISDAPEHERAGRA